MSGVYLVNLIPPHLILYRLSRFSRPQLPLLFLALWPALWLALRPFDYLPFHTAARHPGGCCCAGVEWVGGGKGRCGGWIWCMRGIALIICGRYVLRIFFYGLMREGWECGDLGIWGSGDLG